MYVKNTKLVLAFILALISLSSTDPTIASARRERKPFTVADEIGLTLFVEDTGEAVQFSPDGNYLAVHTERGRLDLNRVEGSLRFYGSRQVEDFLKRSDEPQRPSPIWVVNLSTDKEGPIIHDWRWLPDSSGVAFLERTAGGNHRLVLADLMEKTIEPLTSPTEMVDQFDIRNRQHYIYTRSEPADRERLQEERKAPAIVGTGRTLDQLLFPDRMEIAGVHPPRSHLWAVDAGGRFEVKQDGAPIIPYKNLVLSPDGSSLVTRLPVPEIPLTWEKLYPPAFAPSWAARIHAGHENVQSNAVHQYVRIILQTGRVQALTDAPISDDAGSWAYAEVSPAWSSDGQEILLPGTFIRPKDGKASRPCVAIVDLRSNTTTCVEILKGKTETGFEEGFHEIWSVQFLGRDKQRVMVSYYNHQEEFGTTEYQRADNGTWQVAGQIKGIPQVTHNGFQITVKEGVNDPPLLVATNGNTLRVIWDLNPQLSDVELTEASVYKWKDEDGRERRGGLFKPRNYTPGKRYPLVLQTHGFLESRFVPSGIYPTAFAARALAAAEIVVLQVSEHVCRVSTPTEGDCAVSGYEAAANQLVSEGLVDPERIGIIGFSRTGFYVMQLLTAGSIHIRAASYTDSSLEDFLQYMATLDRGGNAVAEDSDIVIGARPFGEGLQEWLKRSPGFNLDKVSTPLLVVGEGPFSLLCMWGPYAGLRYLHKPVDIVMLNTQQHVLTNPAVRLASQGGSVDWFRFWLQDYEDPDPAKAEQYARWRELRKLQQTDKTGQKSN